MNYLKTTLLSGALLFGAPLVVRAQPQAQNPLAWTEWQLLSPSYEGLTKPPFLKFSDKRLSASVGLNGMSAGYVVNGSQIKVEPMISTMMAGPEPLMKAENLYAQALQNAQSFALSNGGTALTLSGTTTLSFKLTRKTPDAFVVSETKTVRVAPQLGPQMDGDQTPKYLQLEDLSEGVSWGRFTEAKIEGFTFVPGVSSVLKVAVERNERTQEKRLRLIESDAASASASPSVSLRDRTLFYQNEEGEETKVADGVWKEWLLPSGVLYAGSDGAGGFENEGQSLWHLDLNTGAKRKILAEVFPIENVRQVRSSSGRLAYVLSMRDGGLGAPHVAVADPARGLVWRQTVAEVRAIRNGRLAVAILKPRQEGEGTVFVRWLYPSLDALLKRPVIRAK